MKEYDSHINQYAINWHMHFSCLNSELAWGDKSCAEIYLDKYWLNAQEYEQIWKPIQLKIFKNLHSTLPEYIFYNSYSILPFRGGSLFQQNDFDVIMKFVVELGDKNLILIQNTFGGKETDPAFRMKFPIDITWEEITSGNYISSVILESMKYEFFVFSESGLWGRYAASDYKNPLILIGFKQEALQIFTKNNFTSEQEMEEIVEWLPDIYKRTFQEQG